MEFLSTVLHAAMLSAIPSILTLVHLTLTAVIPVAFFDVLLI